MESVKWKGRATTIPCVFEVGYSFLLCYTYNVIQYICYARSVL